MYSTAWNILSRSDTRTAEKKPKKEETYRKRHGKENKIENPKENYTSTHATVPNRTEAHWSLPLPSVSLRLQGHIFR
jgi:hypothetical protein